jgi:predicted transcriptional regulator
MTNCTFDPSSSLDVTKKKIFGHILQKPGIRFRQLLRLTGLPNGTLTYHLSILEKKDHIRANRFNYRTTRYYPIMIPEQEMKIVDTLQNNITRQIAIYILENDSCTFSDIVEYVDKRPSTVSYHLKRLKDGNIVTSTKGQKQNSLYNIINRESISVVINKYKDSFLFFMEENKFIDGFNEMMDNIY